LPAGTQLVERLMKVTENGVEVIDDGVLTHTLDLDEVPLVMFNLGSSMLEGVVDYQIALLNLESSDVNYAWRSNFPFYTEKISDKYEFETTKKDIEIGATKGRAYTLERPGFIHPSPEPLKASMEKQLEMRKNIRQLVNLNVANMSTKQISADAMRESDRSLTAGLAAIAAILEAGERKIAELWAVYEGESVAVSVSYPKSFTVKTDKELLDEANDLLKYAKTVPSLTLQREIVKESIALLLSHRMRSETIDAMCSEVDTCDTPIIYSEELMQHIEKNLVSAEYASKLMMYPDGEVAKAVEDHKLRLERIRIAQQKTLDADTGSPDGTPVRATKMEKTVSQTGEVKE